MGSEFGKGTAEIGEEAQEFLCVRLHFLCEVGRQTICCGVWGVVGEEIKDRREGLEWSLQQEPETEFLTLLRTCRRLWWKQSMLLGDFLWQC